MNDATVPGARALYSFKVVALGWLVIHSLFWQLAAPALMRATASHFALWAQLLGGVSTILLLIELVLLIPFAQGRRGTSAESLAGASVILVGAVLLIDLVDFIPAMRMLSSSAAINAAGMLAGFASDVCLWLALSRTSTTTLTPSYVTLLSARASLSFAQYALPRDRFHEFLIKWGAVMGWSRLLMSVAASLLMISLLRQLALAGGPAGAPAAKPNDAAPSDAGWRDVAIGSVMLGAGLAVTLGTYSMASSGGGRYFVATGALAWGAVRLVRGLIRLIG